MAVLNKLTDTAIRKAKPMERDYKLSDGGGMFLLVKTNGAKYWRIKFRVHGKEKQLGLGVYPEVSLSKARSARSQIREQLQAGIDPAVARKVEKLTRKTNAQNTFESVGRAWVEYKSNQWTPRHVSDVLRTLERNLFPKLGNIPIAEIDTTFLRSVLETVQDRGALEQSKRLRQRCSAIFRYGQATGLCNDDPAEVLKEVLKQPVKRNYPALSLNEMPEFLDKISRYNTTRQTELAIQLMMLTFVRTGELCGARWEEVDFDQKVWNIPKERMKRRRPHFVPLSKQALNVLRELHQLNRHSEFVFPKRGKPREIMSNATILRVIDRVGYKGRMTGHGFRSVASTALNESQLFHPDAIERQLSHEQNDEIRAAYNRAEHIKERIKIMQWWADELDEMQRSNSSVAAEPSFAVEG